MDALAVYKVTKDARERAIKGEGPTLIETVCYIFGAHALSGDDPTRYREESEDDHGAKKDPVVRFRKFLESKDLWNEEKEKEVMERAREEVNKAIKEAEKGTPQSITGLIDLMYDANPSNIKEQYEYYKGKES